MAEKPWSKERRVRTSTSLCEKNREQRGCISQRQRQMRHCFLALFSRSFILTCRGEGRDAELGGGSRRGQKTAARRGKTEPSRVQHGRRKAASSPPDTEPGETGTHLEGSHLSCPGRGLRSRLTESGAPGSVPSARRAAPAWDGHLSPWGERCAHTPGAPGPSLRTQRSSCGLCACPLFAGF